MYSEIDEVLDCLRRARMELAQFCEEYADGNATVYSNLQSVLGKLRELGASLPAIVEELDKE